MPTYWIINTKAGTYSITDSETFDGEWKNRYPHTEKADWHDVMAFKPWAPEQTSNGICYAYDLCRDGGLFTLYVDITKHTKADIEAAKEELRRLHDVVSLHVMRLRPASSPPAPKPDPLAKIAALLSGNEWTPDTLNEIADIVRAAGYEIKDIEEV